MLIQSGKTAELPVEEIDIGRRQRRSLGDIDRLAASIAEVGLLQPILITAKGKLIAGQRRLEAHRRLKRTTILCWVVEDLKDAMALLQAEITENTCRQPFSPSEAVSAAGTLLPLAQEAANNRMIHRAEEGAYEKFSEGGVAMEQIARLLDMSRPTLEKARKVVAAARQHKQHFGDLVERMDRTGKVNGVYQEMLRRKGQIPDRSASYFTVRMNVNGSVEISGLKNKIEIITHLHILIGELQKSLPEDPPQ